MNSGVTSLGTTGAGVNEAANSRGMKGALNSRAENPLRPAPTTAWQEAARNRLEMFPDRADRASPACRRRGKAGDKELRSGG